MILKYAEKMWGKRPLANSVFHSLGGIGIGFLLVSYWNAFGLDILTWGWILAGVSLAGHVWAWMSE